MLRHPRPSANQGKKLEPVLSPAFSYYPHHDVDDIASPTIWKSSDPGPAEKMIMGGETATLSMAEEADQGGSSMGSWDRIRDGGGSPRPVFARVLQEGLYARNSRREIRMRRGTCRRCLGDSRAL